MLIVFPYNYMDGRPCAGDVVIECTKATALGFIPSGDKSCCAGEDTSVDVFSVKYEGIVYGSTTMTAQIYADLCNICCGQRVATMLNQRGANVIGYPVGVYSVTGRYLGVANNQAEYVTIWNAAPENAAKGLVKPGPTTTSFILTGDADIILIGLRFWGCDALTGVTLFTGDKSIIDWGDGTPQVPSNTVGQVINMGTIGSSGVSLATHMRPVISGRRTQKTYPDTTVTKHVRVFHNEDDDNAGVVLFSFFGGNGEDILNFGGNLPRMVKTFQFLSAGAGIVNNNPATGIKNWAEIRNLEQFSMNGSNTVDLIGKSPDITSFKDTLRGVGIAGQAGVSLEDFGIYQNVFSLTALLMDFNQTAALPPPNTRKFPKSLTQLVSLRSNGYTSEQVDEIWNGLAEALDGVVPSNLIAFPTLTTNGNAAPTIASFAARNKLNSAGWSIAL